MAGALYQVQVFWFFAFGLKNLSKKGCCRLADVMYAPECASLTFYVVLVHNRMKVPPHGGKASRL